MLIVLLFDLKAKIYYMTYEKVMGKPHPMVRKHRLLRAGPGLVLDVEFSNENVKKFFYTHRHLLLG